MMSFFRLILIATALLTSGVLQVAAAAGEDRCCAEKSGAPCQDCPPGVACTCCPFRGAVQFAAHDLAPAASPGVAVAIAVAEPSLWASAADIFHPPRA